MKIQKVKLSDIKPYFNNPRNNQSAVAPTEESIKRYGFVKPIIVDKNGVIIAGHTRYLAAFQLGMTEVPVIYSDMDEEKAKEFRIADNKIAEKSSFNEDQLIEELRKLEVPEDMQSFFFEDVNDMLNFDANSFGASAQGDYGEDYGAPEEGNEEPSSDGADQSSDVISDDSMEDKDGSSYDEEHFVPADEDDDVHYDDLYKVVTHPDGKKTMKVLCPYCGNIEDIEIK